MKKQSKRPRAQSRSRSRRSTPSNRSASPGKGNGKILEIHGQFQARGRRISRLNPDSGVVGFKGGARVPKNATSPESIEAKDISNWFPENVTQDKVEMVMVTALLGFAESIRDEGGIDFKLSYDFDRKEFTSYWPYEEPYRIPYFSPNFNMILKMSRVKSRNRTAPMFHMTHPRGVDYWTIICTAKEEHNKDLVLDLDCPPEVVMEKPECAESPILKLGLNNGVLWRELQYVSREEFRLDFKDWIVPRRDTAPKSQILFARHYVDIDV